MSAPTLPPPATHAAPTAVAAPAAPLPAAPAALAAPAAPAPPPASTMTEVLNAVTSIAGSVAAGLIPADMIVKAIEKGEGAIEKAVSKMPPAQQQQFIQMLQRIINAAQRASAPVGARRTRRKAHRSRRR